MAMRPGNCHPPLSTHWGLHRWLTNCCSPLYIGFQYRNRASKTNMDDKSLYSGLIRLHILHHAAEEPVYGIWIADELARHGYKLSAGTLYPILHGLENKGYLRSHVERNGKSWRRMYAITPLGRKALRTARHRVHELFGEMFGMEHHHR
jgi:DNA-binding PadR family transcriptional regulator